MKAEAIASMLSRCPVDDSAFVSELGYASKSRNGQLAIGVRKVIANFGMVPADRVMVSDRFLVELVELPFWCSLDPTELCIALEDELRLVLDEDVREMIPNPELQSRGYRVGDFVRAIVSVLEAVAEQKRSQS